MLSMPHQKQVPLLNPYLDLFQVLHDQDPALQLALRKKLIWAYSWAIPSTDALYAIARHSPILELGAGSGYWAWLLRQAGAKVVAFDQEPHSPPQWCPIEKGSAETISQYLNHSLFLCWPPKDASLASDALEQYLGDTVIYVGEWQGRTADSRFHHQLRDDWKTTEEIEIPCWPGFSDRLYIFERKKLNK
jgi:hypothetical protein